MKNGNVKNNLVKVVNWNLGSRLWKNKTTEINHLVLDLNLDVIVISEANIRYNDDSQLINIPGYRILTPKNFEQYRLARLAVLVKHELNYNLMEDKMNMETPSIWLKFPRRGMKPFVLGTFYREHTLVNQPMPNLTDNPRLQRVRWAKLLDQWASVQTGADTLIVVDLNLDHQKWMSPDPVNQYMVEDTKNKIETLGFAQYVRGPTRFWKDTTQSLLDQVWTNNSNIIIHCKNLTRPVADHNIVETH